MDPDAVSGDPAGAGPSRFRLEGRELSTFEELRSLDPRLADLFQSGHSLARTFARSEHTPALILMLAHAGRELSNGLLRRLDTSGTAQPSTHVAGCDAETESQRDSIAQCVDQPPDHPLVTRWLKLHRKLVAGAHYPYPADGPSIESVAAAFLELSDLLFGRIAPYFTTSAELDELIALASPSPDDRDRLKLLLVRPQQRHYFFSNAVSADWIDLLADSQMFSSAPGRIVFPDGSWKMGAWPEGKYLARMAAMKPDRVTALLEGVPTSIDNPAVWITIVDAALSLPGPNAARLGLRIATALPTTPPVALPHQAINLVKYLAEQQMNKSAFTLANALLAINDELPSSEAIRPRQLQRKASADWLARFDGYDLEVFFDKALPVLTSLNSKRTIAMLAQHLDKLVARASPVDEAGDPLSESSFRWSQGLLKTDMDDDVRGMFSVALARTGARVAVENADSARVVWTQLAKYRMEIFDRIRLVVLTGAGPLLQEELDAAIGNPDILEPWDEAQERAALLRAQFASASPAARNQLAQALERGPSTDALARMVENIRAFRREDSDHRAPNDVEDTREALISWQSHRLRWFHDRVPAELIPLAKRIGIEPKVLSAEEQALNETGHYSGGAMSWRGNRAPTSVEDLGAMSVAEIAELLRTWQPTPRTDEDPYDMPSFAGLQDTLSAYSTAHPSRVAELLRIVFDARGRPGYLTALLAGLRKAVEAKADLPWNELIPLAAGVIDRCTAESAAASAEEINIDEYGDPHHVRTWWQLFREAVDLITKGCNLNLIPFSEAGGVWSLTDTAVRSPLPWTDVWNRGEAQTLNEAMMAGWNTAAGDATELLVDVALWEFRNRVEKNVRPEDRAARIAEVETLAAPLLTEVVRHNGPVVAGPQAILGHYLPQVMLVAPLWFDSAETLLLDTGDKNPLVHPMWGAYLARGGFYADSFRRLRPWYARTAAVIPDGSVDVDAANRETDGGATEGLMVKVMAAFIRGLAALGDEDRLVEQTIAKVSPKVRPHAYWQFFRGWSDQAEPVSTEAADRLVTFWAWRLDELEQVPESEARATEVEGLMWFLSTPYLPTAQAIALGRRTIALNTGRQRVAGNGWERMLELANDDPDGAYEIIELLVDRELKAHGLVLFDQVAPALEVALKRGNAETRARAVRLVHKLGENNQDEFKKLLPRP